MVKLSVAITLLYFVFRESNNIDEKLSRDLFEIMPNLELPFLEVEMKRLESLGVDVNDLRVRIEKLKQLEDIKDYKNTDLKNTDDNKV